MIGTVSVQINKPIVFFVQVLATNWPKSVSNGMDSPNLNGIAMFQSGCVYQPLDPTGAPDMKVSELR